MDQEPVWKQVSLPQMGDNFSERVVDSVGEASFLWVCPPLRVREVHRLVDERLGGVSRDTVRSCLTEGVRLKRFGLERVAYGTYWLDSEQVQA